MNDRATVGEAAATQMRLGGFVLDRAQGELLDADGRPAALRRQALAVLLVLGRRANQVVTKDELMRLVWPDVVVGEGSLAAAVADIRRVLGDSEHRLVRNIARRGYMLVPPGATSSAGAADAASTTETLELAPASAGSDEQVAPTAPRAAVPSRRGWLVLLAALAVAVVASAWFVERRSAPAGAAADRPRRSRSSCCRSPSTPTPRTRSGSPTRCSAT